MSIEMDLICVILCALDIDFMEKKSPRKGAGVNDL